MFLLSHKTLFATHNRLTLQPQISLDSVLHGSIACDDHQSAVCSRCVSGTDTDRTVRFTGEPPQPVDGDDDSDDLSTLSPGARLYHECKAIRESDVFPLKVTVVNDVEDDNGLTVTRILVPTSTPVDTDKGFGKTVAPRKGIRSRLPLRRR